jgi:hypothetical protein
VKIIVGFVIAMTLGYLLNRGVFVGSSIAKDSDGTEVRYCRYIFPSGITTVELRWSYRQSYCKLLLE